jgi:hypothetical protein
MNKEDELGWVVIKNYRDGFEVVREDNVSSSDDCYGTFLDINEAYQKVGRLEEELYEEYGDTNCEDERGYWRDRL